MLLLLSMFGSTRAALGYFYAHHQGPQMSRPRYTDEPRAASSRSRWDGPLIGALLYGKLGVKPGGIDDIALRMWATTPPERGRKGMGARKPNSVRRIEDRLRPLLRKHGLMKRRKRLKCVRRHDFTDAYTGEPVSTLVELGADDLTTPV